SRSATAGIRWATAAAGKRQATGRRPAAACHTAASTVGHSGPRTENDASRDQRPTTATGIRRSTAAANQRQAASRRPAAACYTADGTIGYSGARTNNDASPIQKRTAAVSANSTEA